MGAARPRRWKLPFHRATSAAGGGSSAPCSPSSRSSAPPPGPASPARSEAWAAEAVPEEFLCPISRALMADPVILPSGNTYERACLQACAELAFLPPGADAPDPVVIPNSALKAAIGTWCARAGRASPPAPPSPEEARRAVLRAMPPPAEAGPKSVRTAARRPAAAAAAVAAASTSNSSYSSPASTSSYGSASEITAAEDERPSVKDGEEGKRIAKADVGVQDEAVPAVDPLEDEVVGKVLDADEEGVVARALAALREATRESAARRRALCTPRLLGAVRRVLLLPRHAGARADAAAALVNLSLEPGNKVRIVRAGAVPALVETLARPGGGGSGEEAREHAAGALFGLALHEDNRAAIGVLGAVPPLLDLLASPAHPPRARRDAGMALYHLSLAAVNQSKLARLPGAAKALLAVASSAGGAEEPGPVRRLALMVACNVAACAEGRAALMDAGAVASVSGILLSGPDGGGGGGRDLEEWCVSVLYAMSRGSLRFRGLARAAGADRALRRVVADEGAAGVRREMARKTLRAMRGDLDDEGGGDYDDLTGSSCGDGADDCGGSIVSDGLMSFRRRQRELGASSCGNTAEF